MLWCLSGVIKTGAENFIHLVYSSLLFSTHYVITQQSRLPLQNRYHNTIDSRICTTYHVIGYAGYTNESKTNATVQGKMGKKVAVEK